MYKNIIITTVIALFLNGCISTNIFKFGELDNNVANKKNIINNFEGKTLTIDLSSNIETLSVILPKDNMTVILRLKIPNIEDVLYMNISDGSGFKINKLIRRVSSLNQLDKQQDGWVFEPSEEKGIIKLQLFIPEIYLYNSQYNPKLMYSFKRGSRSVQDSIKMNFIRQNYYVSHDKNGHEQPNYTTLNNYCKKTSTSVSDNFNTQINQLNKNRVDGTFIEELKGVCK